jgi:hypothetical protein
MYEQNKILHENLSGRWLKIGKLYLSEWEAAAVAVVVGAAAVV